MLREAFGELSFGATVVLYALGAVAVVGAALVLWELLWNWIVEFDDKPKEKYPWEER